MNLYGTARAIAGQKYGLQDVVESHVAAENIEPGATLFGKVGDDRVFNAHNNVVVLVASANLVTGNKLAAKVNGVELDEVDVREVELLLVGPVTGAELERIVVYHQVALVAADSGAYVDGWKGVTGESVVHFRLGVLSEL